MTSLRRTKRSRRRIHADRSHDHGGRGRHPRGGRSAELLRLHHAQPASSKRETNLADMRTRLEQYFLDNRAYPAACVAWRQHRAAATQHQSARQARNTSTVTCSTVTRHRPTPSPPPASAAWHDFVYTVERDRTSRTTTGTCRLVGMSRPSAGSARRAGTADVMAARRACAGFTLIELMVALAIAALLLLIGLPSFTTFLRNSEIRSTSESLVNGLRAATAEAANRKIRRSRSPSRAATSAELDDSGCWTTTAVTQNRCSPELRRRRKPGRTRRSRSRPPASSRSCFNGLGRVVIDPANPDDHIRRIDIDSIVAGEARPLRIIVDDPIRR